jgi:transcriptional regulator with XRE-family HTH domain
MGRPPKNKVGRPPKGKEEPAPDPYLDETIRIIARRIADARKKRGLTQAQLGEKIGASQSFVFEIEQAASNMMLRTLLRMARGLELDPRELFPGGPSPTASGWRTRSRIGSRMRGCATNIRHHCCWN